MRIRGTKPEFWRSRIAEGMDLSIVFDGPFPTGPKACQKHIPGSAPNVEYLYLLFGDLDELLYVGRSWRPADRFTKHRRKPWWDQVRSLVIVKVQGATRPLAESTTRRLEALAITALTPSMNVAAPSRMAVI